MTNQQTSLFSDQSKSILEASEKLSDWVGLLTTITSPSVDLINQEACILYQGRLDTSRQAFVNSMNKLKIFVQENNVSALASKLLELIDVQLGSKTNVSLTAIVRLYKNEKAKGITFGDQPKDSEPKEVNFKEERTKLFEQLHFDIAEGTPPINIQMEIWASTCHNLLYPVIEKEEKS